MTVVVSEQLEHRLREIARMVLRAPFTQRTWAELAFLLAGSFFAGLGIVVVGATMLAGIVLAVTFVGLSLVVLSLRSARGFASIHRRLAAGFLDEEIPEPSAFAPRPGFLGWLQSGLRDRTSWRSVAYVVVKVPLAIAGFLLALSTWFDAAGCLVATFHGSGISVFGLPRLFVHGPISGFGAFVVGVVLFFAAPWVTRLVLAVDRLFMRALLGPDAVDLRLRSLERSRAQTVDASAATLRRIERDLHDGTQAQLVAVAMRLGMVKEKLADTEHLDLAQVAELVNEAHQGAKEAIVELRDLARGIHPPALDTGLEGALTTLAARSTVPTDVTISLEDRPTPAIESIAYFCVAELLANVAQHASASRAAITCAQHGRWLRLVVRDDGVGGAQPSCLGSTSSGLSGLAERIAGVDGQFEIVSPERGPTVITVDLPLHA